jgi:hypothetical protein
MREIATNSWTSVSESRCRPSRAVRAWDENPPNSWRSSCLARSPVAELLPRVGQIRFRASKRTRANRERRRNLAPTLAKRNTLLLTGQSRCRQIEGSLTQGKDALVFLKLTSLIRLRSSSRVFLCRHSQKRYSDTLFFFRSYITCTSARQPTTHSSNG